MYAFVSIYKGLLGTSGYEYTQGRVTGLKSNETFSLSSSNGPELVQPGPFRILLRARFQGDCPRLLSFPTFTLS